MEELLSLFANIKELNIDDAHKSVRQKFAEIENADLEWFRQHAPITRMVREPYELERGIAALDGEQCRRVEVSISGAVPVRYSATDGPWHHGEPEELILPSKKEMKRGRQKPQGF